MNLNSSRTTSTTVAGGLYILAMVTGIFSIAYAVDDPKYLVKAASNVSSVQIAAFFHLLMAPIYLGMAVALYPTLKKDNAWLAFGFAAFKVIASVFVMIGVILLLVILMLSQKYVHADSSQLAWYKALGELLQFGRDLTNHVATILALSFGGLFFYAQMIRSKLLPLWLSWWGLIATLLTMLASYLVMFQATRVITSSYIAMNVPMALHDLVLGIWLIVKGLHQMTSSTELNVQVEESH